MSKSISRSRSLARQLALQGLYQWQLGGQPTASIEAQFQAEQDMSEADIAYFQELLRQAVDRRESIDTALQPFVNRPLVQIDPVEKAILLLAGYELMCRPDIPYRVVINEAVELAKRFGAEQSHRFINGVLDKAAHELRADATPSKA